MTERFVPLEIQVQRALGGNVTLRWVGRPVQGPRVRPYDWLLVPFSLLWGGFAMFWEMLAFRSGDFFMELWGAPLVLFGFYLIAGRFFVDAYFRDHTIYAVGEDAVYFVRDGFGAKISTLDASALSPIEFRPGAAGSGTIVFADPSAGPRGRFTPQYTFEGISGAQAVYEMVSRLTERAGAPESAAATAGA
jgi:hypothetical protein